MLDFLTVRGSIRFTNWSLRALPALTRQLSGEDWQAVVAAQLLASEPLRRDMARAYHLAPREMEQSREHARRPTRGRLRGKPDMAATMRERRRRHDETLWIARPPIRRWQTPDNAAIIGALVHLSRAASSIAGTERSGWRGGVREAGTLIERLLRAEPARHVEPNHQWASHQLPPGLTSRSDFYRGIWRYAEAWRASIRTRDSAAIRKVLMDGWLVSEDDDQLYELYVLSQLVETLHDLGPWDRLLIRPSMLDSSSIVEAQQDDLEVEVRYDRAPATPSVYSWLFARYDGVDARVRRPDLQVIVRKSGTVVGISFIEVKATRPATPYGRDSIYKVLGYLKDYGKLWEAEEAVAYPRAVIVYTSGVRPLASRTQRFGGDEVVLTDHRLLRQDLGALIVRLAGFRSS